MVDPIAQKNNLVAAYSAVVQWSVSRPFWQRDALRRLVAGALTPSDLEQLAELCLQQATTGRCENFEPLSEDHVPSQSDGGISTELSRISQVRNVNLLAADQELLFASAGITVVYGDNGAGKSGYSRILKQICRVRGKINSILPNVYADAAGNLPSAEVAYNYGVDELTHSWQSGKLAPPELRQITLFDTSASNHLLTEEDDVAFAPEVLTLLEALAKACGSVESVIDGRVRSLHAEQAALPRFIEGGMVSAQIKKLGADGCAAAINELAVLSDVEVSRLSFLGKELEALRQSDPATKAKLHKQHEQQLRPIYIAAGRLAEALSDVKVQQARDLIVEVSEQQKAVEADASLLEGTSVEGVGSETWMRLWRAARAYSQDQAYPHHEFPHVGAEAHCVLCHQELQPAAALMLTSLEKFARDESQSKLDVLRGRAKKLVTSIREAVENNVPRAGSLAPLGETYKDLDEKLARFGEAVRARTDFVCALLEEKTALDAALPVVDWRVSDVMEDLRAASDAEATQAEELIAASDPEALKKVQKEYEELSDRALLSKSLAVVIGEHDRKVQVQALVKAKALCNTQQITIQVKKLSEQLITERLKSAFQSELKELGADRLKVEIAKGDARKGKSLHRLAFSGVKSTQRLTDVLSEGECRAVALAGFFTELSTSTDGSAIVFDDPVCSLDHNFRLKAARRIALEAKNRQVLIFTHDLAFVEALNRYAADSAVSIAYVQIERGAGVTGLCDDGLSSLGAPVKERIGKIKVKLEQVKKMYDSGADAAWRTEAYRIAGQLRAAWERAVEERLFQGVISRFDRPVQTNRLRKVSVEDDDWDTLESQMTEISRWIDAHDAPASAGDPAPSHDDLRSSLDSLELWGKQLDTRAAMTERRRKKS
ncbi:AAA family ATPase [Umezawaea tangerina]|uniref:AAA domain-containing protein n=1 Tax=Umezawaea tangerina TaxID=84725 RepID=A0A2T0T4B2_9PSEU|nr:AAA family ATPase [Umezawaea tangerina]PRY40510.1 AAA domain-containing protein [Umezawaea tangerina]